MVKNCRHFRYILFYFTILHLLTFGISVNGEEWTVYEKSVLATLTDIKDDMKEIKECSKVVDARLLQLEKDSAAINIKVNILWGVSGFVFSLLLVFFSIVIRRFLTYMEGVHNGEIRFKDGRDKEDVH